MARTRRRRRPWRALLVTFAVVLAGAVGAAVALDLSVDRQDVDGLASPDAGVEVPDSDLPDHQDVDLPGEPGMVRYVLVAGLDDRSVLTPEERRELSTGDAEGARTEAIAVVRLDPDRDDIDVLRFPRDLLVTRCDGTRGRINAAYGIGERNGVGGASCLVDTITSWSGIPLHHVVEIDFRGFVDLVDAVDGVTLDLDAPVQDDRAGLDLPAGQVDLDGADALAFVRARGMDSDLGRIDRQQELVAAALDQILDRDTLTDPARLTRLVRAGQRHLTLDSGLTARRSLQLAQLVAGRGAGDLVTRTIPGEVETADGPWFLRPDEFAAQELFADLLDGGFSEPPPVVAEPGGSDGDAPATDRTPAAGGPDGPSPGTSGAGTSEAGSSGGLPDGPSPGTGDPDTTGDPGGTEPGAGVP